MDEVLTDTDTPQPGSLEVDRTPLLRAGIARCIAALERATRCPKTEGSEPGGQHGVDADVLVDILDALDAGDRYRVLRRLTPDIVDVSATGRLPGTSVVVVVDVETTGLDHRTDEVIELGMLRCEHVDGEVGRVTGELSALNEPKQPIRSEITRLTGITPAMVAGKRIDLDAVADMLLGVDLVVAHHAGFDRPFCEALHGGFAALPWACSVQEIDWRAAGFEGAKLGHLLLQSGFFHRGHRALDDCHALLHLLRIERPASGRGHVTPLLHLLTQSAAETRRRVWADDARFDKKDLLKARGYRWHPGSPSTRKAWWRDVSEGDLRTEVEFLHREIYRHPVTLRTERVTARDRYRSR